MTAVDCPVRADAIPAFFILLLPAAYLDEVVVLHSFQFTLRQSGLLATSAVAVACLLVSGIRIGGEGYHTFESSVSLKGDRVALASTRGLSIYELATGHHYSVDVSGRAEHVTLSPDGKKVAFSLPDGVYTCRVPVISPRKLTDTKEVRRLSFHEDSAHLLVDDYQGHVSVYSFANGGTTRQGSTSPGYVYAEDVAADLSRICAARPFFPGYAIEIWGTEEDRLLSVLQGGDYTSIFDVHFSPDTKFVAACMSNCIRVWKCDTTTLVKQLTISDVLSLCWASDTKRLFLADRRGRIHCWDLSNEKVKLLGRSICTQGIELAYCSKDRLAAVDKFGRVEIWSVDGSPHIEKRGRIIQRGPVSLVAVGIQLFISVSATGCLCFDLRKLGPAYLGGLIGTISLGVSNFLLLSFVPDADSLILMDFTAHAVVGGVVMYSLCRARSRHTAVILFCVFVILFSWLVVSIFISSKLLAAI